MSETVGFRCPDTFYPRFERTGGEQENTHYCPGCGHGLVHKYIAEAIADLSVQDRTVLVSSVGCTVFSHCYLDVGNVQVPLGRCSAAATGLKRAHPDSLILGYQGDGVLSEIGTNEILQAANRGENLTIFLVNNAVQATSEEPTPPTAPSPLRVCELLATLEAPYYIERVALGDNRNNARTREAVRKAIRCQLENRGFSLVEVLAPCPTRWNLPPTEAASWVLERMAHVFPPGVFRDGREPDPSPPRRRRETTLEELPGLLGLGPKPHRPELPGARPIDETRVKIAGSVDKDVLELALVIARAGVLEGRQVSLMPSRGPEMHRRTATCSLIISDEEIESPLVERPHALVALNDTSLRSHAGAVVPGGRIFFDDIGAEARPTRDDVEWVALPVGRIAAELGDPRLGSLVMLGAVLARSGWASLQAVEAVLPSDTDAPPLDSQRRAIVAGSVAASRMADSAES